MNEPVGKGEGIARRLMERQVGSEQTERRARESRARGNGMGLVTDAPHRDLCYRIIGAAMDVHNRLGPGLRELHYQRALMVRL